MAPNIWFFISTVNVPVSYGMWLCKNDTKPRKARMFRIYVGIYESKSTLQQSWSSDLSVLKYNSEQISQTLLLLYELSSKDIRHFMLRKLFLGSRSLKWMGAYVVVVYCRRRSKGRFCSPCTSSCSIDRNLQTELIVEVKVISRKSIVDKRDRFMPNSES